MPNPRHGAEARLEEALAAVQNAVAVDAPVNRVRCDP
jgi:hypothetical protein